MFSTMCDFLRKYFRSCQSTTINLCNQLMRYLYISQENGTKIMHPLQMPSPLFMPLPPPRFDAPLCGKKELKKKSKKARIPKGALKILREAASSDEKTDESSSDSYTDEPANKLEASKKKPKTHFRKTKKPGRA